MDLLPNRFHGLLTRPHIRQKLVGFLSSQFVEMKSKKVETFLSHVHNTGLGGMKGQFQFDQDLLDLLQSFLGFSLGSTDDDEVSGPREFHPRALSEPDMNLSAHPAPIIQPKAEFPSASEQTFQVDSLPVAPSSRLL